MDSTLKCFIFWRRCSYAASLTGANFLVKNYKFNAVTYFVMGLVILTVGFCAYTQVKVFSQGHVLLACTVFAHLGILLQGLTKFYYLQHNAFNLWQVSQDLLKLHEQNQHHQGRKEVLNICIDRCLHGFTIFCFMYASTGIGFFCYPVFAWYFFGLEKQLFVEIHIPFVDPTTQTGYIITLCYQVVIITAAVAGTLTADALFFSISAHYTVMVDIFSISAKEFSQQLKYDGSAEYRKKIKTELRELFLHHQRLIEFLRMHDEMFGKICFFEIFATNLMLITSLFVGTVKLWIPGYILGVASFYQMICYCSFGTFLELSNDQVLDTIWEVQWYYLTRDCCYDYGFMLKRAQIPTSIMLGGIAPLSVATAQEVISKIYSFYMLLRTFVEGKTFDW